MSNKVLPEERVHLLKRWIKDFGGNILFWDSESSPNEGYFWRTGSNQHIGYKQIKKGKESKMITIQWMWEGQEHVEYLVWDKTSSGFDDSRMVATFITDVLRKHPTDKVIIVGQNHKAHDHKLLNERAKVQKLIPPIHNSIKVDTFRHSLLSFQTASHGLDARSEQYGLGGKLHTDWTTWTDILEGKKEPEDEMIPYGLKDVTDLRTIFWNDLPYYTSLPADLEKILLKAKAKCSVCEEKKQRKYELEACKVNSKNGWKCLNCGSKFLQ